MWTKTAEKRPDKEGPYWVMVAGVAHVLSRALLRGDSDDEWIWVGLSDKTDFTMPIDKAIWWMPYCPDPPEGWPNSYPR